MTLKDTERAVGIFEESLRYIISANLLNELQWQDSTSFTEFTETEFLRESAWVILCSGFKEKTIRRIFDYIALCFCDWESSAIITASQQQCYLSALSVFNNKSKLKSILKICSITNEMGFDILKEKILESPISELQALPHIGPITAFHLAKNLGLDVAKPDRHLVHAANVCGFSDVHDFCGAISTKTGVAKKIIDLAIWRYLADNPIARNRLDTYSTTEKVRVPSVAA